MGRFSVCLLFFLGVLATFEPAHGQEPPRPRGGVWSLTVENDAFGGNADNAYTSGVRLSYLNLRSRFPGIAHRVAGLIPGFTLDEKTSNVFYSFGQNLYTPNDIRNPLPQPGDRPWAGFTYASMGLVTTQKNRRDEVELTAGIVGPAALGEMTQKFVHKNLTDSPRPMGWDHQLGNEPALALGWQRSRLRFLSGEVADVSWSVAPYYGATLGNLRTNASIGVGFSLGPGSDRDQDPPVRVRPAMPGTGFFDRPDKGWSWNVFGGVEGRAIVRDIFLDGNTFDDSPHVDKNPFVADANLGLAMTLGRARISYAAVYRTKEFEGQDYNEIFGTLAAGWRF